MHVLTKIFIVLVALLAVALVPFVVAYAHNEDAYKAKFEQADAQRAAAQAALTAAESRQAAAVARAEADRAQLQQQITSLQKELTEAEVRARQLETQLAEAEAVSDEILAKLSTQASTLEALAQINAQQNDELRIVRTDALECERGYVDLADQNRDLTAQLDVAEQARRTLQEELQQVKEQRSAAMDKVARYAQLHGPLEDQARIGARQGATPVTVNLDATVVSISRNEDQVLAEINAGERDGVQVGWQFSLARGSEYIGKLRIIETDINRSTGVVMLQDITGQTVRTGDTAIARANR